VEHKKYPYLLRGLDIDHPITKCGLRILPTFPCGRGLCMWLRS
jgi:hypothetical protein